MTSAPPGDNLPGSESSRRLALECRSFARALVGDAPSDAVRSAYERAHGQPPLDERGSPIDRVLIRLGSAHPWLARLADAYAAVFVRRGVFRTKLVVLLAMLESGSPHHRRFERASVSRAGAWALLILSGLAAVLALVLGVVLFGPTHLIGALFRGRFGRPPERAS